MRNKLPDMNLLDQEYNTDLVPDSRQMLGPHFSLRFLFCTITLCVEVKEYISTFFTVALLASYAILPWLVL